MWKLRSGVTRLTGRGIIKSLGRRELFRPFSLQNRQNADEIDSAGDNLDMESDSQANQRSQTKVLPAQQWHRGEKQLHVIAFWTSHCVPGAACKEKYFFIAGRWGTSPIRGPPLPREQAPSYPLIWEDEFLYGIAVITIQGSNIILFKNAYKRGERVHTKQLWPFASFVC